MTTFLLKPFGFEPNTSGVGQVEVVLDQVEPSTLQVCYHLPNNAFHRRTQQSVSAADYKPQNKLYEGECIEIFLSDGTRTLEYNFHPDGLYFGFATQSYRTYVNAAVSTFKPLESHYTSGDSKTYTVSINWKTASQPIWPDFKPNKILTPVILPPVPPRSGRTYWAQNHPSDKPDFHNVAYYVKLG